MVGLASLEAGRDVVLVCPESGEAWAPGNAVGDAQR
jgi:hypothetical protein